MSGCKVLLYLLLFYKRLSYHLSIHKLVLTIIWHLQESKLFSNTETHHLDTEMIFNGSSWVTQSFRPFMTYQSLSLLEVKRMDYTGITLKVISFEEPNKSCILCGGRFSMCVCVWMFVCVLRVSSSLLFTETAPLNSFCRYKSGQLKSEEFLSCKIRRTLVHR